jgi:monoamine oxidase
MSEGVSRRSFLRSVGVAGGAGALFETMAALGLAPSAAAAGVAAYRAPRQADLSVTGRPAARVVVLGAGIAGLATAYELAKAGHHCRVLEAKSRPGGRNWTVRGGTAERDLDGHLQRAAFSSGQYMNAGPARIAQSMVTLDYCRELGVEIQPFVNQNADATVHYENGGPLASSTIRHRTVKADVYGYVAELLAKATDQGALDGQLRAEDKERLLAFLQNLGALQGRSGGWAYSGTSRRGYAVEPGAGAQPGTVLGPPPSLSDVFAAQLGRNLAFEFGYDQAMMMYQPVGGMDRIVSALVAAVGATRIRYGAQVTQVTDLADGVEVSYQDSAGRVRVERADFCVAALPPHVLARIPTNLGASVTSALGAPVPVHVGKMGLEYRRRWWEEDERVYGGISNTDMDLTQIWYPSYGFHGRRGILIGYYNTGAAADVYGALTPADRISRAVAQGAKIHGASYRTELAAGFSAAWHRVPFIEGGWVSWPSRTSGEYDLLNKPAGRVYFAGDWLSYLVAWQAGAFESARKVVTEIHQRVLAG